MSRKLYFVNIDHVFLQDSHPISFASEANLQKCIEEALLATPNDSSFRSFEFDSLREAQAKLNDVKRTLYLKSDHGYSRPSEWYFLEFEVAWIEECETDNRGDFCNEKQTPYAHLDIPLSS